MGASILVRQPDKHANALGEPVVPCKTCETPTTMLGTRTCDACWEVEHRLAFYLTRGGDKAFAFVAEALKKAMSQDPALKRGSKPDL